MSVSHQKLSGKAEGKRQKAEGRRQKAEGTARDRSEQGYKTPPSTGRLQLVGVRNPIQFFISTLSIVAFVHCPFVLIQDNILIS
ncbi:MAG: hypothetical protein F6K24_20235 [Okeania sp. SIO2D1]|nr:hypothetical protein [Okeania sp. SIO2D1]